MDMNQEKIGDELGMKVKSLIIFTHFEEHLKWKNSGSDKHNGLFASGIDNDS